MEELIQEKLKEIEDREHVLILYAAESGSRATGISHDDSDYDVRFIYVRPLEFYMKLEKTRDVIELPINEKLDINGWDLKKYLQLLHEANPTTFEWMASPVVYRETEFSCKLRELLPSCFSVKKEVLYHVNMAVTHYRQYLKGDMVRAKKYIHALRPILISRWVLANQSIYPLSFLELVESQMPRELLKEAMYLIDLKLHHPEVIEIPRIKNLDTYLEDSVPEIQQLAKALPQSADPGWEKLNAFFLETVTEAWK